LIVQLKDMDAGKRRELETENESLRKELMEFQAKLAARVKEQCQIEQDTKDDLAFQALQHRVEKEKLRLSLLKQESKRINTFNTHGQDNEDGERVQKLAPSRSDKSSVTRAGELAPQSNHNIAMPPNTIYRTLKSLSIPEVGALLRHYDLTLFVEKFRKHDIDGRELSEFKFEEDLFPFRLGRRTQHMKLLHLISDLNKTGVNDKIFLDLKRHNARIKRLTNRMRKPGGPIAQLAMKTVGLGKTITTNKKLHNQQHRYTRKHSPKGNKIIRSNGRNFDLTINTSPQYDDENLEDEVILSLQTAS